MHILGTFAVRMAGSPRLVIGGIAIVLAVSILLSLRLQVSTDISSLMPEHSRLSASLARALEDFGSTDRFIVVLETMQSNEANGVTARQGLKALADQLAAGMEDTGLFSDITYRINPGDRAFFEDLRFRYPFHFHSEEAMQSMASKLEPAHIENQVWQLARSLRASPLGASAQSSLVRDPLGFRNNSPGTNNQFTGFSLDLGDSYFFSSDGKVCLILARPISPSQDTEFDAELLDKLENLLAAHGGTGQFSSDFSMDLGSNLRVRLLGPYVETLYGSQAAVEEIIPSIVATFVGLLILFGAVYRSTKVLLVLAVPLVTGILLISGAVSALTTNLTMLTVGFASMLAGLGVDFQIHLVERFGQERRAGSNVTSALANAFSTSGKGVLAGALSTAAIFGLIATSDFNALQEFGWIMGFGILLILACIFVLLPVLITAFPGWDRKPPTAGNVRWQAWVIRNYRLMAGLGLAVTLVLTWSASGLQLKSNIYELGPMNPAYEASKERVLHAVGGSTNVIMVVTEENELEELLRTSENIHERLEALQADGEIESFESLSSLLPSRHAQLEIHHAAGQWDLAGSMEILRNSLQTAGFRNQAFEPFMANVLSYEAVDAPMIVLDDFQNTPAESWLNRFLLETPSGWRALAYVYPRSGQWEEQVPDETVAAIEGLGANVVMTGVVPVYQEISETVHTEFLRLTLFALAGVFIVAMVFFMRPLLAVLSMIPAVLGLAWTLGLMQLLGIELNLMTMLVAPMILGIGVDDALHVINRYHAQPPNLESTLATVSKGILMTSATTIIGFGSLALADLPALRSLGITVSIGMVCCAVTSLLVLPALLRVFDSPE